MKKHVSTNPIIILHPHPYLPTLFPSTYSPSMSPFSAISPTPIHITYFSLQPYSKQGKSKHSLEKFYPFVESSTIPENNPSCKHFWNPNITKSLPNFFYVTFIFLCDTNFYSLHC